MNYNLPYLLKWISKGCTDAVCFKCVAIAAVFAFCAINVNAMGHIITSGLLFFVAACFITVAVICVAAEILREFTR